VDESRIDAEIDASVSFDTGFTSQATALPDRLRGSRTWIIGLKWTACRTGSIEMTGRCMRHHGGSGLHRREPGDMVAMGDPLVVLEAMKMESQVVAPFSGRIRKVMIYLTCRWTLEAPLVQIESTATGAGRQAWSG